MAGLIGVVQWTCVLYLHSPQGRKDDTNLLLIGTHAENTVSEKVKLAHSIYIRLTWECNKSQCIEIGVVIEAANQAMTFEK